MASSSNNNEDLVDITLEDEDSGGLFCEEIQEEETVAFDARWFLELNGGIRYLFQFYHEIDISRVLEGGPWTFNRKALIIRRLKEGEDPRMIPLNTLDLWTQVHDLKTGYMTERTLTNVGNYIEKIIKPYGTFMKAPSRRQTKLIGAKWLRTELGDTEFDKRLEAECLLQRHSGGHNQSTGSHTGMNADAKIDGIPNRSRPIQSDLNPINQGDMSTTAIYNLHHKQPLKVIDTPTGNVGGENIDLNDADFIGINDEGLTITKIKRRKLSHSGELPMGMNNTDEEMTCGNVEAEVEAVILNLGSKNGSVVGSGSQAHLDARGHSGGVAMLWRHDEDARVLGYSACHVDIKVGGEDVNAWRLTGLYGEPNRSFRYKTWNHLRSLSTEHTLPWCVIGDLNNTLSHSDKRGGSPYPQTLLDGFQEVLNDCNLHDMDLSGYPYTWERVSMSDHCTLLLQTMVMNFNQPIRHFRFENACLREPMCLQVVNDIWELCENDSVVEKISICGDKLSVWGKDYTENFKFRIAECKKKIRQLKKASDSDSLVRYKNAQEELTEFFTQKEVFWCQRSKQLWLEAGDKNSKFFHAKATSRRKNNMIHKLKDAYGCWVDWDTGLQSVIMDYFTNLFSTSGSMANNLVEGLVPLVSPQQNVDLIQDVTAEEVRKALFQMHPNKSPGPDGMTLGFFQKYWSVVGNDVVTQVQNFLHTDPFVNLVLTTVTSVQYMVVNSGREMGPITLARGLRQGDPLSPYLFLLCAEDDSYLNCRANDREAGCVLRLLNVFEVASGQKVNYGKSSIFFSSNTPVATRIRLCGTMGMMEADENSSYLGLPSTMGRNKDVILGQLEQMMAKYWWQSNSKKARGVSWVSWSRLCIHRSVGGLGFCSLRDYNLSLLGKQAWRLLQQENSLVGRLFKARYYPRGSFLNASLGNSPSYIWRSLFETQSLIKECARIRIGNGQRTSILGTPWLPNDSNPLVISTHPGLSNYSVQNLMKVNRREWDEELIRDMFEDRDQEIILSIPLSNSIEEDTWYWNKDTAGFYTVKSSYQYIQELKGAWNSDMEDKVWKTLWKIKVPPKVLRLIWKALTNCLAGTVLVWPLPLPTTIIFFLWFKGAVDKNARDLLEEAVMLCWSIWQARNGVIWNQKVCNAADVMFTASGERWAKPAANMLKINIDGAIFQAANAYGSGVVIRDTAGSLIEAFSVYNLGCSQPEIVEMVGIKEALS
uniref:Reverse transcriptase n=1 Tax=Cannabis sativa TaxID=3483 RepID=A0A803PXY9_CANSA